MAPVELPESEMRWTYRVEAVATAWSAGRALRLRIVIVDMALPSQDTDIEEHNVIEQDAPIRLLAIGW